MDLTGYNMPDEAFAEDDTPDAMPDGKYGAECKGFKVDETSGGYRFMEFEWVILGPTHAGRRHWQKTWLYLPDEPDEKKRKMGAAGIEPASSGLEPDILPVYYAPLNKQ